MTAIPYQHIDLRVRELDPALAFYGQLLPELGFTRPEVGTFYCWYGAGTPPRHAWFGFVVDAEHVANANRIAFGADSREEVDRLAKIAIEAGAQSASGPRDCPEYGPHLLRGVLRRPFGQQAGDLLHAWLARLASECSVLIAAPRFTGCSNDPSGRGGCGRDRGLDR